jgi:hypothetical protein
LQAWRGAGAENASKKDPAVAESMPAPCSGNITMQIKTALLLANPCDDENDDMALLCCHDQNHELFSLARFPDEDEVEITVCDDTVYVTSLKVSLSATLLAVEISAEDAKALGGDTRYEISHDTDSSDWPEVQETLRIILENVGTYVCEAD